MAALHSTPPLRQLGSEQRQDSAIDSDAEECWICLSSSGVLTRPCDCPRLCHRECIATWQLTNYGRREENFCRFCNKRLPAMWKPDSTNESVSEELRVAPVMAVRYNGPEGTREFKLRVQPGPEGLALFKAHLKEVLGFDVGSEFDVTFECQMPATGSRVTLSGINAYGAATHCAALLAASKSETTFPPSSLPSPAPSSSSLSPSSSPSSFSSGRQQRQERQSSAATASTSAAAPATTVTGAAVDRPSSTAAAARVGMPRYLRSATAQAPLAAQQQEHQQQTSRPSPLHPPVPAPSSSSSQTSQRKQCRQLSLPPLSRPHSAASQRSLRAHRDTTAMLPGRRPRQTGYILKTCPAVPSSGYRPSFLPFTVASSSEVPKTGTHRHYDFQQASGAAAGSWRGYGVASAEQRSSGPSYSARTADRTERWSAVRTSFRAGVGSRDSISTVASSQVYGEEDRVVTDEIQDLLDSDDLTPYDGTDAVLEAPIPMPVVSAVDESQPAARDRSLERGGHHRQYQEQAPPPPQQQQQHPSLRPDTRVGRLTSSPMGGAVARLMAHNRERQDVIRAHGSPVAAVPVAVRDLRRSRCPADSQPCSSASRRRSFDRPAAPLSAQYASVGAAVVASGSGFSAAGAASVRQLAEACPPAADQAVVGSGSGPAASPLSSGSATAVRREQVQQHGPRLQEGGRREEAAAAGGRLHLPDVIRSRAKRTVESLLNALRPGGK